MLFRSPIGQGNDIALSQPEPSTNHTVHLRHRIRKKPDWFRPNCNRDPEDRVAVRWDYRLDSESLPDCAIEEVSPMFGERDNRFYSLFEEAAHNVATGARLLVEITADPTTKGPLNWSPSCAGCAG